MKIPIHAIFLDKNNKVVKIKEEIRPWRLTGMYLKANKVLELEAEKNIDGLTVGDELEVICLN